MNQATTTLYERLGRREGIARITVNRYPFSGRHEAR